MEKTRNITNPQVTDYINGFYRPLSDELMKFRLEAENDGIPVILRETEDFLGVLLSILQPARILETGTAVGYSAAYFALRSGADVITIEKDEKMYAKAVSNIEKLGLGEKVRLILGDGGQIADILREDRGKPFDFVFIDGSKSHYREFFDGAVKLCRPGTVIVSDNVLFGGRTVSDIYDPGQKHRTSDRKLREYVKYIYENPVLDTSVITCGDGLAVSRIKE